MNPKPTVRRFPAMGIPSISLATAIIAGLTSPSTFAASTAIQASGATYLAFEAENAQLIAGAPENWETKTDALASGGKALTIAGTNSTGDSPHSFAQFKVKFATAGTYYLYYRWLADPARTGGDIFTANSIWIGNRFGAFSTTGSGAQEIGRASCRE